MNRRNRRYVFIDFENLKKIKFKKLEKVCDRLFILIDSEEENIPFQLVQQTQRLGKHVKWLAVENPTQSKLNYHIAFLLGRFHQKVDEIIEFAILSNDKSFDSLVSYINSCGRSCLRVKRKKTKSEKEWEEKVVSALEEQKIMDEETYSNTSVIVEDKEIIEKTARETIKRLIRSGNRPSEVSLLKNYILLHNEELTEANNVDKIIDHLLNTNEIKIQDKEVSYNF